MDEPLEPWELEELLEEETPELRAAREEIAAKTHPGFKIECVRCGSFAVVVESSLGYSFPSGGWGSIDLSCIRCSASQVIYEN